MYGTWASPSPFHRARSSQPNSSFILTLFLRSLLVTTSKAPVTNVAMHLLLVANNCVLRRLTFALLRLALRLYSHRRTACQSQQDDRKVRTRQPVASVRCGDWRNCMQLVECFLYSIFFTLGLLIRHLLLIANIVTTKALVPFVAMHLFRMFSKTRDATAEETEGQGLHSGASKHRAPDRYCFAANDTAFFVVFNGPVYWRSIVFQEHVNRSISIMSIFAKKRINP